MTFVPADPVISGKPYLVREVAGQVPSSLADFEGAQTLVLDGGRRISGIGSRDEQGARFREKDADAGKDVRVWRITDASGGGFVAVHDATY